MLSDARLHHARPLYALLFLALWTSASLLVPPLASAHGRSLSYSTWRLDDRGADVGVRISLLELSRLDLPLPLVGPGSPTSNTAPVGRYLAEHLRLNGPGGTCAPTSEPIFRAGEDGFVSYRWRVDCGESGARAIESDLLLEVAPSHLHFARLSEPNGGVRERVLVEGASVWPISSTDADDGSNASAGSGFADYVALGIEHILGGWDHLAFVFALVLLATRVGEVARLVTGFTLAHSITLALAVLGWVQPVGHAVEAVIGFSVALIAAENAWLLSGRGRAVPLVSVGVIVAVGLAGLITPAQLPWLTVSGLAVFSACHFSLLDRSNGNHGIWRIALAFAFGLVHGFGFAGVLAEMALPTHRLAPALLGFNVGVELGQLAVVAMIWPLLRFVLGHSSAAVARWAPELASAAICGVGLFWFVLRALGS
jgi:hypothetical protein